MTTASSIGVTNDRPEQSTSTPSLSMRSSTSCFASSTERQAVCALFGQSVRVAGERDSRMVLAAGLAFLAAAIGLATLWAAVRTRSWEGFEAVAIPWLIVGVTIAGGWATLLGVGLLVPWTWARRWALLTFVVVSGFSGWALLDTARRVIDGGTAPVRHLAAPGSLFTVATSVVLLLVFAREPVRSDAIAGGARSSGELG
jgi:fatty acid desaturase